MDHGGSKAVISVSRVVGGASGFKSGEGREGGGGVAVRPRSRGRCGNI